MTAKEFATEGFWRFHCTASIGRENGPPFSLLAFGSLP